VRDARYTWYCMGDILPHGFMSVESYSFSFRESLFKEKKFS
jgi:hypothetical protein